MLALLVSFLVGGLGHEDYRVRNVSQQSLVVLVRVWDGRKYLPQDHKDWEVRRRIENVLEAYKDIGPLPSFESLRHYDSEYGPFTFTDSLLAEVALQMEIIKYNNYPEPTFYYVGGATSADEYQVVVEYARRLFDLGLTRAQVREALKNAARGK